MHVSNAYEKTVDCLDEEKKTSVWILSEILSRVLAGECHFLPFQVNEIRYDLPRRIFNTAKIRYACNIVTSFKWMGYRLDTILIILTFSIW